MQFALNLEYLLFRPGYLLNEAAKLYVTAFLNDTGHSKIAHALVRFMLASNQVFARS